MRTAGKTFSKKRRTRNVAMAARTSVVSEKTAVTSGRAPVGIVKTAVTAARAVA